VGHALSYLARFVTINKQSFCGTRQTPTKASQENVDNDSGDWRMKMNSSIINHKITFGTLTSAVMMNMNNKS
jgi:hypothetical protein